MPSPKSRTMDFKSRAEMQLIHVMNQKQPHTASNFLLEEQEKEEEEEEKKKSTLQNLQQYRRGGTKNPLLPTAEEEMIASVRQLQDKVVSSKRIQEQHPEDVTLIELNAMQRRVRHMEAQRTYHDHVKTISEQIETGIIQIADNIKDTLAIIDQKLQLAQQEWNDANLLLQKDYNQVLNMWESVHSICQARTQAIDMFSVQLNGMEEMRMEQVSRGLRVLTETLMEIAHGLPPEIERIIEIEAYELNIVVISNRKAYAELIARMEMANVDIMVQTRLSWEQGQVEWRRICHVDAINKFQITMNSSLFTNPHERQLVLGQIRAYQLEIHESKRLELLKELSGSTTSQAVQAIIDQLNRIQKEEEEQYTQFFDTLRLLHDAKCREAVERRETLRLVLHGFGALALEGDLVQSKEKLVELVHDPTLEEFFRMAGGLKGELDHLIKKLTVTELIYPTHLVSLRTSLNILVSALPLEQVMEEQGKGGERKAVQTTLEKMRKASKIELFGFLPVLLAQITMLQNLNGMNDVFKSEVEDIGMQIRLIIEEQEAMTFFTSNENDSSIPSKSRFSESFKSSTSLDSGFSSSSMDLHGIRRAQRRLGCLLYASQLSLAFQTHLQFIADQLALQANANDVVDLVITAECNDLLSAREEESKAFLTQIGANMESQSAMLHEQCERLAKYFLQITTTLEESEERVEYVNLAVMDLLDTMKEMDEEKNTELEHDCSISCAKLRHAPDHEVLQEEFNHSNDLLYEIEESYRLYQKRVSKGANHHVVAITKQREQFLSQLSVLFGLVPPVGFSNPLDLVTFLSIKYIDNIINTGETNQEQSTGESTEQHTAQVEKKLGTGKGKKPMEPEIVKERFRTGGIDLEIKLTIPELVEHVLSKEPIEEGELVEALPPIEVTPSSNASEEPVEEDPAIVAAQVERESRFKAVSDKVREETLVLNIAPSIKESLLRGFRETILSQFDFRFKAHTANANQSQEKRVEESNSLLDERLRLHWPRRGRLDVQFYQPRINELYSHKQRQERHVRMMMKKVEAQNTVFEKQATLLRSYMEDIRVKQLTLQTQLPMQQSLAALQGLEVKSKKLLAAFRVESEEKLSTLQTMVLADLATVTSQAQEYIRVCSSQLFPDLSTTDMITGCDYHPQEIEVLRVNLTALEAQLQEKIRLREAALAPLMKEQKSIMEGAQEFKTRYQTCLQSLSMREGLGQKYGIPRRSAQERYRSETTRSDALSARIDELLEALRTILSTKQMVISPHLHLVETDVATQILVLMLRLRLKMFQRGVYFGFVKNTSQLEPIDIAYDAGGVYGRLVFAHDREVLDENYSVPASMPFLEYVQQVAVKCREETRSLYQQEGKLDELPSSGVPLALEEYLTSQAEKARTYVIQQELHYREQVDLFGELLAQAPEVAFHDLRERASNSASKATRLVFEQLESQYKEWMDMKKKHTIALRPDLCSPNNTLQLQELCTREAIRSSTTINGLHQYCGRVLEIMAGHSGNFEKELLAMCKCMITVLDTSVMTLEDLKPFTGEILPKEKRKSLKRLRKVARVLEHGDTLEVKRSEEELKKLTQLGETPRFPKRSWSAIPAFGMYKIWESIKTELVRNGQAVENTRTGTPRIMDSVLGSISITKATNDEGACTALLTHAHRCLMHGRDDVYEAYVDFSSTLCKKLIVDIQERLQDEVKWAESWQLGITKMQQH